MPLYEYECRACGERFEALVLRASESVACRKCGGSDVALAFSVFSVGGGSRKTVPEPGPCGACGAPVRGSCGLN